MTASPLRTVALCWLATVLEGIDIQAIGAAAPKLVAAFGLRQAEIGLVFSASLVGLFLGAAAGGRMSDRFGRKRVLLGAIASFGLFSLLTALAWDFPSMVAARFLTGLGLGGAMPNLIALVAETTPPHRRTSMTTIMWCGTPLGGIVAVQVAASSSDWATVFVFGGIAPLLLLPVLARLLPESAQFFAARRADVGPKSVLFALFGEGRTVTTLLLWVGYFITLLLLHLLLNWLPLLIVGFGFTKDVTAQGAILFNLGGCIGAVLLGLSLGRVQPRLLLGAIYLGMAAGLFALAHAGASVPLLLAAASLAGLFVIGGQFVLYGLVAEFYPTAVRGTGVGATIAGGRLGSVLGPSVVGLSLSAGHSAGTVLLALLPAVLVAGCAMVALLSLRRPPASLA